ncbi:anaphase-promoting complex, cyclosome, subunit 4-domain-containing protein [Scleroderma citrinum]
MQGSRKWEVDIASDDVSATVAGLAWNPNGQTIAVVHDSGRITLHSVQDGRVELSLSAHLSSGATHSVPKVVAVWWFPGYRAPTNGVIPDIFKRDGLKTGSALSILKILPLLDSLQEAGGNVTATDLFAFQGTQTRSSPRASTSSVTDQWPHLGPASEDIAICSPSQTDDINNRDRDTSSSSYTTKEDTLLILVDESGRLHLFLDGSYSLGSVSLPGGLPTTLLYKHPGQPLLLFHSEDPSGDLLSVGMQPLSIDFPLLGISTIRDFARLSSAARELTKYIMSVLAEVREGWLGSSIVTGAKEIGKKWVETLERRLKEEYGHESPNVVLELTSFLATGAATEGLADFIMSSDQTSDRALQKWDSSVTDALTKMRDYSNTRIIPAFQKLHIILEEIHGWSQMSDYVLFSLDTRDITTCLNMVERGIFASAWLATEARKELRAFKQFLTFIRYETAAANMTGETQAFLDFDILEVNDYLMSGLMTSQIDRWFTGSAPQFNPGDLFTSQTPKSLREALQLAHAALRDPSQTAWQPTIMSMELSHLDRNLDALVQVLAARCQQVFSNASHAAARSAVISVDGGAILSQVDKASAAPPENICLFVRQRVTYKVNEPDAHLQYLAIHLNSEGRTFLCLSRMPYDRYAGMEPCVEVALLECSIDAEDDDSAGSALDILDAEFFDDEMIVLIYRIKGTQVPMYVATANYTTLRYQKILSEKHVNGPARKDMIADVLQQWSRGHLMCGRVPITKCRRLTVCKGGSISMAVNGRVGRRVVCVLDVDGTTMEVVDIEGDEMEADEESETEMVRA